MKNDIRFYDTCSLLLAGETLFEQEGQFVVSSITLNELENIKTSIHKDPDIKYTARLIQRLMEENPSKYIIMPHYTDNEIILKQEGFEITQDMKILSDAIEYDKTQRPDETIFVTNDLALKHIANLFFGDGMIESVETKEEDQYCGFLDITPSDTELIEFYESPGRNPFNCKINQYLILRNVLGEVIDIRKWDGERYQYLKSQPFISDWFGKVQPYNHDIYQQMLCDSFLSNKITMARGPAGSGKSFLALAFLMAQLQKGAIDKIIIFCNTVATANSAKLGFYPGTRLEKLLDSQIGNFLIGKFGGIDGVNQLIESNRLELLPLSDIRGYDTTGMKAGIYITEAQNLDKPLIKLALQRIGEDCICIIDGDNKQQVDLKVYDGFNNGMRAMSKAFRGEDIYGEVELKNVYRSKIAQIAERI